VRSQDTDPAEEGQPLIVRLPPPTTERLDRKRLFLAALALGAGIILIFGLKLQGKYAASQAIHPDPLPAAHEVSGTTDPLDQILKIPTTYEGIDRRPKLPAPAPHQEEPPPALTSPPDLPPVVQAPPRHPAPTSPPAPPPVAAASPPTRPEPAAKQPPKRWLFADLGNAVAKPPFPTSAERSKETGGQETAETALLRPAEWIKPLDPTKVLYRAQVIPGLLLQALNSDIPGQVRIMVTRPVTDRFHQGHVLIPQHSILLGTQDGRPAFGQTRVAVTIEEIQFPQGEIVRLQGQMADRSGALGSRGKVNNHYVKIGVGAILSAVLNIGTRGLTGSPQNYQPTLGQEFTRDVGTSVSRSGQSIVDKSLNIPPTLTLKAGTEVTIQLSENLSFARPPTPVK
jgi:type IV secretory pathway VirB10-like protein